MTVDELVVSLLLDPSGFVKGQKDATTAANKMADDVTKAATKGEKAQTDSNSRVRKDADQTSKFIEGTNKRAAQSFEKVLGAALALFAVFAGARSLEEFTRKIITLEAAVGRLSHNINSTPETISSIGRAAERMGGSFGGAVSGLQGLSDAFEELRTTGTTSIMEPLARLQALGGKKITFGKDVHENFLSIADDLKALDAKDPALADFLGRQILHDDTLVNLAKKGRSGVLDEEAKSPKISAADAKAAQDYQRTWESLNQSIQHVGQTIVTDFAPAATAAITKMDDWVRANQGWIESGIANAVKELTNWLRDHKQDIENFGAGLAAFASTAGSIASAFSKQSPMVQALEIFILLLGRVIGPLNLVLGSARALGALRLGGSPGGGTAPEGGGGGSGGGYAGLGLRGALAGFNLFELAQGAPDQLKKAETDNASVDPETSREAGMGDSMRKAFSWIKDKLGLGSADSRTKDDIADTAKATGEMRDLLKAQKDGAGGFTGVTVSSGGLGGSGQHVGGTGGRSGGSTFAGASLGDHARGGIGRGAAGMEAGARESFEFWKSKGLTPEQAAGLAGMEQGESSFNPRAVGDSGQAHGAFQWHADRRAKIRAGTGIDIDTATHKQQLEAAYWEFQNTEKAAWDAVKKGRTATDAARAGVHLFERPADKEGQSIVRGGMAEGWLKRFNEQDTKGTATATAPIPAGTSTAAVTDAEVFAAQQRVLNGSRDPKDKALVDRYHQEQAAPAQAAPAPAPAPAAAATPPKSSVKRYLAWTARGANVSDPDSDDAVTTVDRRDPRFAPKPAVSRAPTASAVPTQPIGDVGREDRAHPTYDDAANHLVRAYRESAHRGPTGPVKVELTDTNAEKIGRAYGHASLDARARGAVDAKHAHGQGRLHLK